MAMKSTIRCCISCILPCGALDVIRIVHVNGRVEEITGTIYAAEILKAHPKHILKKPTTKPVSDNVFETESAHHRPTIVVVPPDALLQRGKIYFLIPVSSHELNRKPHKSASAEVRRKKKKDDHQQQQQQQQQRSKKLGRGGRGGGNNNNESSSRDDDKYLSEILSEKEVSSHREKRRGRVAVWRPHLESITETLSDVASC